MCTYIVQAFSIEYLKTNFTLSDAVNLAYLTMGLTFQRALSHPNPSGPKFQTRNVSKRFETQKESCGQYDKHPIMKPLNTNPRHVMEKLDDDIESSSGKQAHTEIHIFADTDVFFS